MTLKPLKRRDDEIRMAVISKGQMIGFNDVIDNRAYATSLKCISSQGVVLAIKAEEFINKMQSSVTIWRKLLKLAEEKDKEFDSQIWNATYNF
jgi:CRP-like cAMP-binding protein